MSSPEILPPGKKIYGVTIGISILDRRLPRPVGDTGNAATFDFPVLYDVVPTLERLPLLDLEASQRLYPLIRDSCLRLVDLGADALATTCGFNSLFQQQLASDIPVPIAATSLLQIPTVLAMLPAAARVAVLVANSATFTPAHLDGVGLVRAQQERVTIVGLEDSAEWQKAIIGQATLDVGRLSAEIAALCASAVDADPTIRAFVAEAANLGPYSTAIQAATGLPAWDNTTLINWLCASSHATFPKNRGLRQ